MKPQYRLFSRFFSRVGLVAVAASTASSLSAAVLMLDLGSVAVTPSDETNSPLHAADVAFTDTSWNSISTSIGAKTGLVYADGSSADGVSVYVGRSSNTPWTTLTFAGGPTNVTTGTNPGGLDGVFSSTSSIGRDGHYAAYASGTGDPALTRLMGVSIGGLAAGTYEIFLVGLNPQLALSNEAAVGFWAVELGSTANYDATALVGGGAQAVSTNSFSSSWVEGDNYAKLTFTLNSSDSFLTLISLGLTDADQRGYLNAIQIVAIPEPANAAGLMGLAICFGLGMIRRPNRRAS